MIGKRVADAVVRQDDMLLAGVSDVVTDWRARMATRHGFQSRCDARGVVQHDVNRANLDCALKQAGLLQRARGTLLRRATDPWESHEGGIMNTLVPA